MKGEFVEPKNTATFLNMFSKLQHHHHHHHQQQEQQHQQHQQQEHHHHHQQQQQHPFSHHFQLSRESQTSEEDNNSHNNSAGTTTTTPSTTAKAKTHDPSSGDGATIEVVRRPRGRPPGSKNKPRPPVFVTREPVLANTMSPYILEVPGGADVVEGISNFCRRKSLGICVLTGSGTVANVTLRQPSATPGATITFHGRFDILSISATFMPQNAACPPVPNIFAISLAGPQGQIVGGSVVGPLVAAGTVFVIAATFSNPSYHQLPMHEEQRNSASGGGGEGQSPVGSTGGGGGGGGGGGEESEQVVAGGGESCGMSMYSCHLPGAGGDVIWAPTARPPPPY